MLSHISVFMDINDALTLQGKITDAIVMGDWRPADGHTPLSAHNKMKRRLSELGTPGKMDMAAVHDDSEEEGNCQVQ